VLAFTAAMSFLTAVICGLAPALEGARTDVQDALKDGGTSKSAAACATAGYARRSSLPKWLSPSSCWSAPVDAADVRVVAFGGCRI
jgi:hypothetical protein